MKFLNFRIMRNFLNLGIIDKFGNSKYAKKNLAFKNV